MPRQVVEPVVTVEPSPGGGSQTKINHPAFGQITVTRLSGRSVLYGSDFEHNSSVRVTIYPSEMRRDLSRDWFYHGIRPHITVDMSEAQWATFVSSFSAGSGVPCTIRDIDGDYLPEFPLRDSAQLYKGEATKKLADLVHDLQALKERLKAGVSGLSKTKQNELIGPVDSMLTELAHNVPFVVDSFSEHMEKRVENAKVEVHAYMHNAVQAAGLQALGVPVPLQLEHKGEDHSDQPDEEEGPATAG